MQAWSANRMTQHTSGRPQLIDLEKILQAALELGVDNLSMHAVARRLDVSVAALYRYVDSREHLLDACMDAFCARIELPSADLPWPEHLHAVGQAFRRALLTMPGMSDYGMKIGPTTPAAFAIIDSALAVLLHADFEPKEAWNALAMVVDHAFYAVRNQENYVALEQKNGPGGYKMLQLQADELARTPYMARVLEATMTEPGFPDFDGTYRQQLDWLITGISARRSAAW